MCKRTEMQHECGRTFENIVRCALRGRWSPIIIQKCLASFGPLGFGTPEQKNGKCFEFVMKAAHEHWERTQPCTLGEGRGKGEAEDEVEAEGVAGRDGRSRLGQEMESSFSILLASAGDQKRGECRGRR